MGYLVCFLASGAYVGFSPLAPGTAGSLLGVVLFLLVAPKGTAAALTLLILLIAVAVWLAGQAEVAFGKTDASHIVIDEIAGQWVALSFLPMTGWFVVGAFLLFRFFDIWKPWKELEGLHGGFGVVVDDLAAGVAANLLLQAVRLLWAG